MSDIDVKSAKLAASLVKIFQNNLKEEVTKLERKINGIELIEGPAGPPGDPQGPKGEKGDTGRGIYEATLDGKTLYFTFTDGKKQLIGEVVGAQGPQGIEGPRGKVGPKGDKGEKGERGAKGETGDQGPKGERGFVGEKGDKGEKGEKGDKGDKGDVGPVGPKGETGSRGERGIIGPQGKPGKDGARGPKGDKGDKGDAGKGFDDGKFVQLEKNVHKKIDEYQNQINIRVNRLAAKTTSDVLSRSPGSGEVWLKYLDDVDYNSVSNPSAGHGLVWNNTIKKWQANTVSTSGGGGGGTGTISGFAFTSNVSIIDSNFTTSSVTTTGLSSGQLVDEFDKTKYNTAKYLIQITETGNNYMQSSEMLVINKNASNTYFTEYARIFSDYVLGTFSVSISGNKVQLTVQPKYSSTTIKTQRIGLGTGAGGGQIFTANVSILDSNFTTSNTVTSGFASGQVIDTFNKSHYKTAKYLVQVTETSNNYIQSSELFVLNTGSAAHYTEYARIFSDYVLATFSAAISGNNVQLTVTPKYTSTRIKTQRIGIKP